VVPDQQYNYAGGYYGTVDFPVEPADHQVIAQWQGSSIAKVDPSSVTVEVRNISNIAHQAGLTVTALGALGFNAINVGQAAVPALTTETMVRYHPGAAGLAEAQTVLQSLQGAVMMQSDPAVPDATVTVDTGTSVAVAAAALTPSDALPASTPSSTQQGATSAASDTTSTVPTPGHQPVSSATDQTSAWDPIACVAGQPVVPS
jgi:hypothetical protein